MVTEHEWTQPRPDIPRTDGKVSVVVWCATESGIMMDGELIGFPEVAREMIRLKSELSVSLALTLRQLRIANVSRCAQVFHSVQSWTPERWSNAMAGECGEVCNAVKKLNRVADGTNTEKDPQTEAECVTLIAAELADVIIYADLLSARLGIDLDSAVRDKFNQVSILRGATQRL